MDRAWFVLLLVPTVSGDTKWLTQHEKLPTATESREVQAPTEWRPLANLRREIDRLFDDLHLGAGGALQRNTPFDVEPFWRGEISWTKAPAVDIAERENEYEVTAEL